jgi:hypothetical protein
MGDAVFTFSPLLFASGLSFMLGCGIHQSAPYRDAGASVGATFSAVTSRLRPLSVPCSEGPLSPGFRFYTKANMPSTTSAECIRSS